MRISEPGRGLVAGGGKHIKRDPFVGAMRLPGAWRLGALAIPTMLFLQSVHAFLPSIYAKNIETLSLAPTTAYALVFLLPFVFLAVPRRKAPLAVGSLGYVSILTRFGLLAEIGLDARLLVGAIAVGSYLLYLPLHLLSKADEHTPAIDVAGFVLGFSADAASRAVFFGVDPFSSSWVYLLFGIASVVGLVCVWRAHTTIATTSLSATVPEIATRGVLRPAIIGGVAFGALFSLEITLMAYPQVLARFVTGSEPTITIAVLGGLGGGIAIVLRGFSASWPWLSIGNLLLVAAIVDLATFRSPIFPFLVAFAQLVVVADLAVLVRYLLRGTPSSRSLGVAFGIAGVVFVLYLSTFVFALLYAYVPGRAFWEGLLPAYLVLTGLVAAGLSIAVARRSRFHRLRIEPAAGDVRRVATWGAVGLLFVAGLGSAIAPEPATPSDPSSIMVMTYNVRQGIGGDGRLGIERIAKVIEEARADIVTLQDSDTARISSGNLDAIRFLAVRLGYYEAYGPPTRDQIFGVSILSRFPILRWETILLPSLEAQRVIVLADVQVGSVTLRVYATHFGDDEEERKLQASFVRAITIAAPSPRIFLGGINSDPRDHCPGESCSESAYSVIASVWTDGWTAAGHSLSDSAGFTWPAESPAIRIDYVFLGPGMAVDFIETPRNSLTRVASDYLPVIARVLLP